MQKNPENVAPSSSSPDPTSFLSSRPSQSSLPLSQKLDTESDNTTTNISPGSTLDVRDPSKKYVRLEGAEGEIIKRINGFELALEKKYIVKKLWKLSAIKALEKKLILEEIWKLSIIKALQQDLEKKVHRK